MVITFIIIIMIDQEQTSQQDARMSQRQPAPSLTTHHLVTVDGDLSYHRSVTTEIMIFISTMMRMVFRLQFKFLHIFRERWGSDGSLPLTPTGLLVSVDQHETDCMFAAWEILFATRTRLNLMIMIRNDIDVIGVRAGCTFTGYSDSSFNGQRMTIRAEGYDRLTLMSIPIKLWQWFNVQRRTNIVFTRFYSVLKQCWPLIWSGGRCWETPLSSCTWTRTSSLCSVCVECDQMVHLVCQIKYLPISRHLAVSLPSKVFLNFLRGTHPSPIDGQLRQHWI